MPGVDTVLKFSVPCVPVAQPRQRHRLIRANGRQFVTNYTPKDAPVQSFKATVRLAARQVYSGPPLEGPISLTATFIFPRPGRLMFKRREMIRCHHVTRPDGDNLWKSLADALTGIAWRDDAQICELCLNKVYASGSEQPGVEIEIRPL